MEEKATKPAAHECPTAKQLPHYSFNNFFFFGLWGCVAD